MGTATVRDARFHWDGQTLDLNVGRMKRVWRLNPGGLITIGLHDTSSGVSWVDESQAARSVQADWLVRWIADGSVSTSLTAASVQAVTDAAFSSPHVAAELVFRYPYLDSHFDLRWRAWAYPETSGVRTQIALRAGREFLRDEIPGFLCGSFVEQLLLSNTGDIRRGGGYYNDTQHRNFDHTPLLKEDHREGAVQHREVWDWANLLCIERRDGAGIALVKESHKCVNQEGFDTGAFIVSPDGVAVSGVGYDEIDNSYLKTRKFNVADEYVDAWATWLILYGNDGAGAIKRFDRARFAPRSERDLFLKANTWGSRGSSEAPVAATEENVLRELASCADLGVEALEIDDGWQHDPRGPSFTAQPMTWRPQPERFPSGWDRVRDEARSLGLSLLLWAPGNVEEADLLWNLEAGDFRGCKLDFLNFHVREDMDAFLAKVRRVCQKRGPRFHINTDLTENLNRVGYFLGREYGPLYLENRELTGLRCRHIAYHPHLVLRDAWHLAHYLNLNQVLLSFIDKETVPPELSDAHQYSHAYCFAITMMGLPLFFMETQFLSALARDELRPLIALYKRHRDEMFRGIVSPIGEEPDGASWCGFVSHDEPARRGYLTFFRELQNRDERRAMDVPQLGRDRWRWRNLISGAIEPLERDDSGRWLFHLSSPASFAFYQYECERA